MQPLRLLVIADPALPQLQPIRNLAPAADVHIGNDPEWLAREVPDADVIVHGGFNGREFRAAWPLARKARWVHSLPAGVENILSPEFVASPVPLTNARGVYAEPLAEFVLAAVLHFAKRIALMMRQQRERRWELLEVEIIAGRMMGVIGYGEIGQAAGRLARACGMRVQAVRRRPSASGGDGVAERVLGTEGIADVLSSSDYVVLAAPNAPQTKHLIGAPELAAMRNTAVLINVGRGSVVDEAALAKALGEKKIGGAALDVFEREPLPAESPLWGFENVLVSPHSADRTADWLDRAVRRFLDNFELFRAGRPLVAVVDKAAGY